MIELSGVGILKLSITEDDLSGNGKCQASKESLVISCLNYLLTHFKED